MTNKQTAVEFAVDKLEKFIPIGNQIAIFAILEQAKQMEKEHIMMAYIDGRINQGLKQSKSSEQYYNETYDK